jgi:hypothetical protein
VIANPGELRSDTALQVPSRRSGRTVLVAAACLAAFCVGCALFDPGVTWPGDAGSIGDQDLAEEPASVVEQLCEVSARRCNGSVVEECAATGLAWAAIETCDSDLICRSGVCEAVPTFYGDYCHESWPCPASLDCIYGLCLSQAPGGPGASCLDLRECLWPTFCSGLGECTFGEAGDPCEAETDCSERAPVCGLDGRCGLGGIGDACAGGVGCGAGLLCDRQGVCGPGSEGTPCEDPDECNEGAPFCVESRCRNGSRGDPCDSDQNCAPDASRCGPGGLCQPGTEGDRCADADDCHPSAAPICGEDGRCRDGLGGESCVAPGDCAGEEVACVTELRICSDGSESEWCYDEDDCAEAPIIGSSPEYSCVSNHCFDGSIGDPCVDQDDCSPTASACEQRCLGAPCDEDDDCSDSTPVCGPWGCQLGGEGDPCDDASDCAEDTPVCDADQRCAQQSE